MRWDRSGNVARQRPTTRAASPVPLSLWHGVSPATLFPSVCSASSCLSLVQIIEKSGYQALPWVRYITQNGDYQIRMS